MKLAEIKSANAKQLKAAAKGAGIKGYSKLPIAQLRETVSLHFFPADDPAEAKENALAKSKAAKSGDYQEPIALVFDALKSLHDAKTKIQGIETEFWKLRAESADVGGCTIRFDHKAKGGGIDRAIFANINKALNASGVNVTPQADGVRTILIRKGGGATVFVPKRQPAA